jgi:hypothetical protein
MDKTFNKIIKSQVFLSILTVTAVMLLTVGTTYAIFQVDNKNTTNQVISLGTLDATLTSGTGTVTLSDLYPTDMSSIGTDDNKYSFTVKNTGTYALNYEIYLLDNTSSFLTSNTSYSSYTALSTTYYQYIDYKLDSSTTAKNLSSIYNTSSKHMTLLSGTLSSGASETHTIQFWLDNGDTTTNGAPNDINGTILALNIYFDATVS